MADWPDYSRTPELKFDPQEQPYEPIANMYATQIGRKLGRFCKNGKNFNNSLIIGIIVAA